MELGFWKIIFRILLAAFIGALAGLLFRSVLPAAGANGIAIGVAIIELVGGLATARNSAGVGIRFMLWLGEIVLAWPCAAWLLVMASWWAPAWLGLTDRGFRIGLAAAIACAIGMFAARHGYGRESARLVAIIVAVAIPAYAILAAVVSGDGLAVIAGCIAAAVAPATAGVAHVWPDGHYERLRTAGAICLIAMIAVIARLVVVAGFARMG